MAIPVNVETLLNGGSVESGRIEFQERLNPDSVLHTICAFANDIDNTGGGYILIGAAGKDGQPVFPVKGIPEETLDSMQKEILNLCRSLEPFYKPVVQSVELEGNKLMLVWVTGGRGRPYKAPREAGCPEKYYYIRRSSGTVQAGAEDMKELFYISASIPSDNRECLPACVEDLDQELIREYLRQIRSPLYQKSDGMSIHDLADVLKLLSGPPELEKPVNAAVLMFTRNPSEYLKSAYIQLVEFPLPDGNPLTVQIIKGPVPEQLERIFSYFSNYVLKEKIFKKDHSPVHERYWNYPMRAIQEIVANAVCHQDYSRPDPVTIRITLDEIEVISYPGFHRSITDEDIAQEHIQAGFYRNRRMGDFLKELHLMEGRKSGFANAGRALEANGSGKLQIDMNENRDYVSVRIPVHPAFQTLTELSDYQKQILEILKKNPCTLTELARSMGYKGITSKLKKNVEELKSRKDIVLILSSDERPRYAVYAEN